MLNATHIRYIKNSNFKHPFSTKGLWREQYVRQPTYVTIGTQCSASVQWK